MSRTRNQLWPLVLLIVCALIPQLFLGKADPSADSGWINLMDIWQPDESSSAYRFWLPAPQPLQVTLIKWGCYGGYDWRSWEISIAEVDRISYKAAPVRQTFFRREPPFDGLGKMLTGRRFLYSTEEFFGEGRPGFWYRRHKNTWQFLSHQRFQDTAPGTEIVPRAKIKLSQECEYGEGYFTWQPDSKWLACDRHGNIEP